MIIQIVDDEDRLLGLADDSDLNFAEVTYRVSALLVRNSRDQVLLAKRASTLDHHPNIWGTAVAGTLENDETYESNIYKEAAEEIGLTDVSFTKGPKIHTTKSRNYFCQWYFATIDKPASYFAINKDEVDELAWFDVDSLKQDLQEHPDKYIPDMYNTMVALGL